MCRHGHTLFLYCPAWVLVRDCRFYLYAGDNRRGYGIDKGVPDVRKTDTCSFLNRGALILPADNQLFVVLARLLDNNRRMQVQEKKKQ